MVVKKIHSRKQLFYRLKKNERFASIKREKNEMKKVSLVLLMKLKTEFLQIY